MIYTYILSKKLNIKTNDEINLLMNVVKRYN